MKIFTVGAMLCAGLLGVLPLHSAQGNSPAQAQEPSYHHISHEGPEGVPGSWKLTWADEFKGHTLGPSWINGWTPSSPGVSENVSGYEQDCYLDRNVSVYGGKLHLKVTQEPVTCRGKTQPYAGGLVRTEGRVSFEPGQTVESRIKTATGPDGYHIANSPAFWTDGTNWPTDGEIDTWEGGPDGACSNIHDTDHPGGPGFCVDVNGAQWHTYAAHRGYDNVVDFYIDGKKVNSRPLEASSPHYIILGNGVSTWPGTIVKAPATMTVDYVRVYSPS